MTLEEMIIDRSEYNIQHFNENNGLSSQRLKRSRPVTETLDESDVKLEQGGSIFLER